MVKAMNVCSIYSLFFFFFNTFSFVLIVGVVIFNKTGHTEVNKFTKIEDNFFW